MMKLEYDLKHDLLYIRLSEAPVYRSLGDEGVSRIVDYDEQGEVVGIELLSASKQIETVETLEELAAAVRSRHAKAQA